MRLRASSPFPLRPALAAAAALLAFGPAFASAQDAPLIRQRYRNVADWIEGPIVGPAVAAIGPDMLVVGWSVADGPDTGVYLRERSQLWWRHAARRIPGATGAAPRDLAIAFDPAARVHMVWTAITGQRRRVFYAVVRLLSTSDKEMVHGPVVLNPLDDADADFPQFAVDGAGGGLVAWQSGTNEGFSIQAVRIAGPDFSIQRLPAPAESGQMAMAPQLLPSDPPLLSFFAMDDASPLRVLVPPSAEPGWTDSEFPRLGDAMPPRRQPMIALQAGSPRLPLYYWGEEGESGAGFIQVARPGLDGAQPTFFEISTPEGIHRQPRLVSSAAGDLTIAWERFDGESQTVRLGLIDGDGLREALAVSPPEHRFASGADHVTVNSPGGLWSVVVWVDEHRRGGSGELGMAEVIWPALDSRLP